MFDEAHGGASGVAGRVAAGERAGPGDDEADQLADDLGPVAFAPCEVEHCGVHACVRPCHGCDAMCARSSAGHASLPARAAVMLSSISRASPAGGRRRDGSGMDDLACRHGDVGARVAVDASAGA